MNSPDDALDDQLRRTMTEAVPPSAERRMRAQLAAFRSRLDASGPGTPRDASHRPRFGRVGLGLACAATVLAIVAGIALWPRPGFARVAVAVLQQPWIHLRTMEADGRVTEDWVSPARDISARRAPDSSRYEDHRTRVYHAFDQAEGVVYRGPIAQNSPTGNLAGMGPALKAILQGAKLPDRPLQRLDFLGPDRNQLRVLDQSVSKITEDSHDWLDYRLTLGQPRSPATLRLRFKVDPITLLPASLAVEARFLDGKTQTHETRFDYPDTGPADIYALGVPRTATLVDRLPFGDLQRIVQSLQAGRERMDPYRAIFVMNLEGQESWWLSFPTIAYRKGRMFRADFPVGTVGHPAKVPRPAPDADLTLWWTERVKSFRFAPEEVLNGSTLYQAERRKRQGPNGADDGQLTSFTQTEQTTTPDQTYPVDWSMRPEFVCRPPMGLGNERMNPKIDLHPTDGPKGCILLSVGLTSRKGGEGVVDGYRYWLDPRRDDIAVRWEMASRDGQGQEVLIERDTVEAAARSPQGVWYATRVRRAFGARADGSKSPDQVYYFYLDFAANLPDSLFDPPTVPKGP